MSNDLEKENIETKKNQQVNTQMNRENPNNQGYNNQMNGGYPNNQGYNNQMNGGYPNNQGYNNQMNGGYLNNQGYNNQMNGGYPNNNQGYNNQMNGEYPNNQGYNNQINGEYPNNNQGYNNQMNSNSFNMDNIMNKISNTRILALIGAVATFVGIFFAYGSFPIAGKMTIMDSKMGLPILILTIANTIYIFKDIIAQKFPSLFNNNFGRTVMNTNNVNISLIMTGIIAVLTIYVHHNLGSTLGFQNYELGFFTLWIGIISLAIYGFLNRKKKNNNYMNYNNGNQSL